MDWALVQSYEELISAVQDTKAKLIKQLSTYITEETTVTLRVMDELTELWKDRAALTTIQHGNVVDWDMSQQSILPLTGAKQTDSVKAYHGKSRKAASKTVDEETKSFFATSGGYKGFGSGFEASASGASVQGFGSTDNKKTDTNTDMIVIRSHAVFKNMLIISPVFHKTEAITVWDKMFDNKFNAMGSLAKQLQEVYEKCKADDDTEYMQVITAAKYMAQFLGSVRVQHDENTVEKQTMESSISKFEAAVKMDYYLAHSKTGGGYEKSKAQQLANSLSDSTIDVEYFAHTFGILTDLKTSQVKMILDKMVLDSQKSANDVKKSRGSAIDSSHEILADAQETDLKIKEKKGMVDVSARLQMEQEEHALQIVGPDALIQAFSMFKAACAAEKDGVLQGAPFEYRVTKYGKSQIAMNMMEHHHNAWLQKYNEYQQSGTGGS